MGKNKYIENLFCLKYIESITMYKNIFHETLLMKRFYAKYTSGVEKYNENCDENKDD